MSVADRAEAWWALDPDPDTRAELRALLEAGDEAELERRFAGRVAFGTAGLRAPLGAGPMRMNRVVVRQATAGLVRFLPEGATVLIGYDARHKSDVFAQDVAGVVAAAGGRALLLPLRLPTPVLAFAVRHLGTDAGVMITASHNPPADNGYKVYLDDGAQIVPPADAEIAAAIDAVAAEGPIAVADPDDPRIEVLGAEVISAYLDALVAGGLVAAREVNVVYTAMHGVGRDVLLAAFGRAGFPAPNVVADQCEPDPDFPTVAFPNPEEPGALDLALARAQALGADVILANDPDADRLGVAIPEDDGDWRSLTGDEIGSLLADHVLRNTDGDDRLVATTVVSSRLLSKMAAAHGVHFAETLTGFKWIVRPALEHPEWRFVFGYEEALGYLVGDAVHDKDGIGAALAFAGLVADLKDPGPDRARSPRRPRRGARPARHPPVDAPLRRRRRPGSHRHPHGRRPPGAAHHAGRSRRRSAPRPARRPGSPRDRCAPVRPRGWRTSGHAPQRHRAQAEVLPRGRRTGRRRPGRRPPPGRRRPRRPGHRPRPPPVELSGTGAMAIG